MTAALLFCAVLAGPAESPGEAEQRLEVARLVRQLDDDKLASREAAERALVTLGPSAIPLLPAATRSMSAEVRVRLERVRKALEETLAGSVAEPSRVTLQGELPLSAALRAIEEQTGNRIVDFRQRFGQQLDDPRISVDLQQVPFWPALDRVLDQAGLTVYNFSGQRGAVAVIAAEKGERPRAGRAVYRGVFRFEGVRILATRDLRRIDNHTLRLVLDVTWEPRLAPIAIFVPLEAIQATAETGAGIAGEGRVARLEVPVEETIAAAELAVPLAAPDRSTQRIASLRGEIEALLPGRVEQFVFENLASAQGVEQYAADVRVTLDQVRKNRDLFEARVRVRFAQPGPALESHRNWVYKNEAYLLDPAGNRLDYATMQATRQASDEIGVAYLFDREEGLDGCQFVYRTPSRLIVARSEFELKDLPLP